MEYNPRSQITGMINIHELLQSIRGWGWQYHHLKLGLNHRRKNAMLYLSTAILWSPLAHVLHGALKKDSRIKKKITKDQGDKSSYTSPENLYFSAESQRLHLSLSAHYTPTELNKIIHS